VWVAHVKFCYDIFRDTKMVLVVFEYGKVIISQFLFLFIKGYSYIPKDFIIDTLDGGI